MAGLVPASPLNEALLCHMIGVAGTSPAMTRGRLSLLEHVPALHVHFSRCMMARPITQSLSLSLRNASCSVNCVMRWR